jgi:hypothetical protein
MSDIIRLAARKLSDPILMDWALDRYQDAAESNPACRRAMEDAWFDQLTLRRWLDRDDDELLGPLFSSLPPERFEPLGEAIGERWGSWGGRTLPITPHRSWRPFGRGRP